MKGAIFIGFSEFVEKKYGLAVWLQTVEACKLNSNGEYLSTDLYDDDEFNALIAKLSQTLNKPESEIKQEFGQQFFSTLMSIAKVHVEDIDNLFDFLIAVDKVIHIEVKKADPLAYTPALFYDAPSQDTLIIRYSSKRKMCHFAEGLILGAADHFKQEITLSQQVCMCKGDKHCLIKVTLISH